MSRSAQPRQGVKGQRSRAAQPLGAESDARDAAPARVTLAQQLLWASRCVQAVQSGRSLADALPKVPAALRPGVQALAFHALRHLGTVSALTDVLAERSPAAPVRALLACALSLLLPVRSEGETGATGALMTSSPSYEPFTVVDQSVEAARAQVSTRGAAGMLNACLRRYLREQEELLAQVSADWTARWNHPAWWVKRVRRDHPQHWQTVLQASNQPAELALRVNLSRIDRPAFMQALAGAGLSAQAFGDAGVWVARPVPNSEPDASVTSSVSASTVGRVGSVELLPGYEAGWFAVQDAAAQLAAPLALAGQPGHGRLRVLDACAAPGGKTAHLLEWAHAAGLTIDLLALEVDAARIARIHENLVRLQLPPSSVASPSTVQVRVADAAAVATWWDGRPFDVVLLDAPCSASGIGRRHPDVRWLRRESDIDQLAHTQAALMDALWPLVRPGGRLVYCTCSLFNAEGAQQVAAFLRRHTDATQSDAPGALLPGVGHADTVLADNSAGGHDGFFYALFEKTASPVMDVG